jgi:hypothetical protein
VSLNFVLLNQVMVLQSVMLYGEFLINSLEGFAITSVRIEGVDHEFSTILRSGGGHCGSGS